MLTFRVRTFAALVAFAVFTLLFMSVGLRWHTYRARASLYAQQEVEHTFRAADYARAAREVSTSDESQAIARGYQNLARMHEKAARECTELRELYERIW